MTFLDTIPHQLFRTLTSKARLRNAIVLERIFSQFFDDMVATPKKADVLQCIREAISEFGYDAESDDDEEPESEFNAAISPEYRIFSRLCADGWILETTTRRSPEIYMPREAQFLLSALVNIRDQMKVDISAEASFINTGIMAAYSDPAGQVMNIGAARRQAIQLRRAIDGILSSLYRIEHDLLSSEGLSDLLARFMERFVEKLLLDNYKALKSSKFNPMRFQRSIMTTTDLFINDDGLIAQAAAAMAEISPPGDLLAESIRIREDLSAIRDVFSNLGDRLDDIERFSYKLERRIATTVRYQESSRNMREETIKSAISLGFSELDSGIDECLSPLAGFSIPYSTATLAVPQKAREPVRPEIRERRKMDPADMLRERMMDAYAARMTITKSALSERLREIAGTDFIDIDDIIPRDARDIAILFELRNGLAEGLPGFEIRKGSGIGSGKYLSGPKLFIRRTGDIK